MADSGKMSELKDERSLWEVRRAQLNQITSELNTQISDSLNRQQDLKEQRAAAEQKYRDGLQEPHKNIEQINEAQDHMAAADRDLAKTGDELAGHTDELRSSIKEMGELDNTLKGLDAKIEKQEARDSVDPIERKAGWVKLATDFAAETVLPDQLGGVLPTGATEYVAQAYEMRRREEQTILEKDKDFHQMQLAEVASLKSDIGSQMQAAKAEMEKVMGTELSPQAQKEFHANEFSNAFRQANDLIAGQQQERDQFFGNNMAVVAFAEQQQNRAGMNQELHQAHYDLTRSLAVEQANINVDLENNQMRQLEEKRLEGQGVSKDQLETEMKPMNRILEQQTPGDVYTEANKIHAQQSPQMAMNPPSIAQSGPGDGGGAGTGPGGGGAPQQQQQGPAAPGM